MNGHIGTTCLAVYMFIIGVVVIKISIKCYVILLSIASTEEPFVVNKAVCSKREGQWAGRFEKMCPGGEISKDISVAYNYCTKRK